MTTNNHEVIFAIVNAGYAEDVMDIARELGGRVVQVSSLCRNR